MHTITFYDISFISVCFDFFRDDVEDYVDITEPDEDFERVIKTVKKKSKTS